MKYSKLTNAVFITKSFKTMDVFRKNNHEKNTTLSKLLKAVLNIGNINVLRDGVKHQMAVGNSLKQELTKSSIGLTKTMITKDKAIPKEYTLVQ